MKLLDDVVESGVKLYPGFEPFADYYPEASFWAQIKSLREHASFLSQTAHETQKYTVFEENLRYSKSRLIAVWPSRFRLGKLSEPTGTDMKYLKDGKFNAWEIGGRPEMIANCVYADRMGNGNFASGDGWKYRGRSLLMLTGKANYSNFQEEIVSWRFPKINVVQNPDLLFDPEIGLWSAMWFWKVNNINKYAANGSVMGVTRKINGGQVGIKERNILYNEVLSSLGRWMV